MKKISLGAIIFLMMFSVSGVSAQVKEMGQGPDCYALNNISVGVLINSTLDAKKFVAGDSINFNFLIKNEGQVFVPGGKILARVEKLSRILDNGVLPTDRKIIGEFFLPEEISLQTGEEKNIGYEWKTPANAESGIYVIRTFFLRGDNINIGLNDLEFLESNENGERFALYGKDQGAISFGQGKLKINAKEYDNEGVDSITGNDLKITRIIENTFKEKKEITVAYKLFAKNYYAPENVVLAGEEKASLDPGEQKEITFDIPKDKIDVSLPFPYYLETKVSTTDGNEFISRTPIFDSVKYNGSLPSLSYLPFLKDFPVKNGASSEVLVCVKHPITEKNSTLAVFLRDEKGKEITKMEKEINNKTSYLIPLSLNFEAKKNYASLKLEAIIYGENNKVLDRYEVVYSAKDLGKNNVASNKINFKWLFAIAILLIIMIGGGWIIVKKRKNKSKIIPPSNGPIMGIFLGCLILGGVALFPNSTKAADLISDVEQTGLGFTADSTGNGIDCGLPLMAGLANVKIVNKLGASGYNSYDTSAGRFEINNGGTLQFYLGRDLKRNINGTLLNFSDDYFDVGSWGNSSSLLHPYKYSDAKISLGEDGLEGFSATFGGGRTNFFSPAFGFGVASGGAIAAFGLNVVAMYPQYFNKPGTSDLIQNDDDCATFSVSDCKKTCCTECGCTNGGNCPAWGCTGNGNMWNSNFETCNAKCNQADSICSEVSTQESTSNYSSFWSTLVGDVRNHLTPDAVTISVVSGGSYLTCNTSNGSCTATGNGTAKIRVTFPQRNFYVATFPLLMIGTGTLSSCTNTHVPEFAYGALGQKYVEFDVRVSSLTLTATCDATGKVTASWNNPGGSTYWQARIDDISNNSSCGCGLTDGWYCNCSGTTDVIDNNVWWGPAYEYQGVPGGIYNMWVHPCNGSGCSPTPTGLLVECPPNNLGYLDSALCTNGIIHTVGWAFDRSTPSQSIAVHFYDGPTGNGNVVIEGHVADQLRSDVNSAFGITGNHGFDFNLGKMFSVGNHPIYAYAIDSSGKGTNNVLGGSPKVATCDCAVNVSTDVASVPVGGTAKVTWLANVPSNWAASFCWGERDETDENGVIQKGPIDGPVSVGGAGFWLDPTGGTVTSGIINHPNTFKVNCWPVVAPKTCIASATVVNPAPCVCASVSSACAGGSISAACTTGSPLAVTGSGPWSWTCSGGATCSPTNCTLNPLPPMPGQCGSADGSVFNVAPTAADGLCSPSGSPTVTKVGSIWQWTCPGTCGGSSASCSTEEANNKGWTEVH